MEEGCKTEIRKGKLMNKLILHFTFYSKQRKPLLLSLEQLALGQIKMLVHPTSKSALR